jgi:hypothetical protein
MRLVPIAFFASCLSLGAVGAACGSSSSGSPATPPADAGGATDSSMTGDDSSTTADGGGDGGDAAVAYPAFVPTDVPQVVSETGPVMTAPKIVPIFYAADDTATVASLTDFSTKVVQTQYWSKIATEYGSAAGTSLTPIMLTDVLPASWDDSQIQAYLANVLQTGDARFPAPDANTLYAFYFPAGVTITTGANVSTGDGGVDGGDDGGDDGGTIDAGFGGGVSSSCLDFGGYHDNIQLDAAHNNLNVAYAVIPRCPSFGPLTGLDAITGPASHEYMEAVTDPFPDSETVMPAFVTVDEPHFFWSSMLGGGEVGDMCAQNGGAFVKFPELPLYTVQRIWSNASTKAGADPCEPLLPTYTYINSIPILPDSLMLMTRGSTVNVKGVHVPVGMSATIEVDLVSSGPTGTWTVSAIDQAGYRGQTPDLTFVWDKTSGKNGDKLHLTITTVTAGRRNYIPFLILSDQGTTENIWAGVVGN